LPYRARTGPSSHLPDCRAYELVTPPDTFGKTPHARLLGGGLVPLTTLVWPARESLVFSMPGGTLPGASGNGAWDSTRRRGVLVGGSPAHRGRPAHSRRALSRVHRWQGQVLDDEGRKLVNTFASVPDAPIRQFNLNIKGGKNGILTVTRTANNILNLCTTTQTAVVDMNGHNGKRRNYNTQVKTPCAKKATRKGNRKN
jgi:hypothetical protein